VDLEDSVPAARKEEARRKASGFFSAAASIGTPARCAVRVNAITEASGLSDLLALRDYPVKPSIVVVPKVESPRDLEIVEAVLGADCPNLELVALIETPRGVEQLQSIVTSTSRLRALIFGAADYAAALGIGLEWEPLSYVRSRVVNGARMANLYAIDTPFFGLADSPLLRQESERARDFGFSGKVAVHPKQVPVLNQAFSPDAAELEQAHRVVSAALGSEQGIATVDGSMIGPPFFAASRRLLDEFGKPPASAPEPATT
jgi:citrate lyase subunit beta/citryl-CoA lyase/(S)-citramalyl-CoA lyase